MPRCSRLGETGWGATKMYIEVANYLRKREVSLMPWHLLCPGINGIYLGRWGPYFFEKMMG
jgi:hypothetical protein